MKHFKLFILLSVGFALFSCTKLNEEYRGDLQVVNSNVDPAQLLTSAYQALDGPLQDQATMWAAQEHTSDECIGPTRGPDWDDNGVWRVLHSHQWNADHQFLSNTFVGLLQAQFAASNVLQFNPSAQQAAEARFIRALSMYYVLDGWDQVPYREDFTDYKKLPNTLKGTDCANFIITEINAFSNDLPDGPASKANKDAAKALLMKMYLNKGVYANRAAPTFDPADMQKVIDLADDLIASGKYSLATDYFDNFAPTNDAISTENIYTLYNQNGERGGNMRSRWFMTLHYNQQPSGWNGFTTLSDFYDKFETADIRKGEAYPGVTDVSGVRVGFLYGQQYNAAGTALNDRKGNPLSFTREVALTENGNNLEVTGIRVIKYPIDYSGADQANNDYVIFRYADVLLMKAEALLRTGDAAGALAIVNEVRQARGVADLGSVDLQGLLDERAREFYFEGNRRQDLVRFGKFLDAWQEKPADADSHTLIFPIPNSQLAANANLVQNPGY